MTPIYTNAFLLIFEEENEKAKQFNGTLLNIEK